MTGQSPPLLEPADVAGPSRQPWARDPENPSVTRVPNIGVSATGRSVGLRAEQGSVGPTCDVERPISGFRQRLKHACSISGSTSLTSMSSYKAQQTRAQQTRDGGPQLSTAGTREFNQDGKASPPLPARIQCTRQYSANSLAPASLRKRCAQVPKVPHRIIGMSWRIDSPDTRWAA
jgi:hypothetical protein